MTLTLRLLATAAASALLAACAATPVVEGPAGGGVPVAAAPAAPPKPAAPATWAHETSDLAPDPGVRFGVLANGMRYAIMKNVTPAGEASLRLRIDAGSLMEREDQLGLAHFMEHMIFNGTKNVPEGEFVKRLERHGLAFGPDTNAYTSFDETVYMLELPETDAATVDTALFLMREAAGEALLEAEAVNRERGVVLSEERTRDTPGYRSVKAQYDFFMRGMLPPKRFPIGNTEVLRNAPRERFVEFYESYYRPENATFIAVGDFDVDMMEKEIRERFSNWRGEGAPGARPDLGRIAPRQLETRTFIETGAPSSIQIAWIMPPELDPDTRAERREVMIERAALGVLNRRFERLARQDDAPFIAAGASHYTNLDALDMSTVAVNYKPGEWRKALQAAEQEQRRIAQHGVRQAELDREITELRTQLKNAVAGQATRRSPALASEIVGAVGDEDVVTTPELELAIFEEAVRGLTAERATAVLRDLFQGQGPLVYLSSPQPITDADRAVAEAFTGSRAVAVAPPTEQLGKAWAYTSFGQPGRVTERRDVADLQTTFVRFDNGVRLTVRPSQNRKDEVLVNVRVGDGQLDLPRDRPGHAWLASTTFTEGGLGKMTTEEIEQALAAEVYGTSLGVSDDAFVLGGRTRPEDLDVQMQVLAAYLTDPAWRPQGFDRLRAFAPNLHDQVESSPGGVLGRDLARLLRSGDRRWGLPSRQEMAAAKLEDVRKVFGGPLSTEPVEVVVVGEITVDEAIKQTAATFGALPRRKDSVRAADATRVSFPQGAALPVRLTHKGRPDQAVGYVAWPTTDFVSDPQRARVLRVLEQVMRLRLLEELREGQAVTYSPSTGYESAWVYPGYGYVAASIEAPPEKLEGFFADAMKIARSLREAPVTADELSRAVKPRVEAIQRSQASNEYWLSQLGGSQTDPRKLAAIRESISGLQKVTPAEVQAAARQYLVEQKAYRLVVAPEAKPAAAGDQ